MTSYLNSGAVNSADAEKIIRFDYLKKGIDWYEEERHKKESETVREKIEKTYMERCRNSEIRVQKDGTLNPGCQI